MSENNNGKIYDQEMEKVRSEIRTKLEYLKKEICYNNQQKKLEESSDHKPYKHKINI